MEDRRVVSSMIASRFPGEVLLESNRDTTLLQQQWEIKKPSKNRAVDAYARLCEQEEEEYPSSPKKFPPYVRYIHGYECFSDFSVYQKYLRNNRAENSD
jgi:hypothetical protein